MICLLFSDVLSFTSIYDASRFIIWPRFEYLRDCCPLTTRHVPLPFFGATTIHTLTSLYISSSFICHVFSVALSSSWMMFQSSFVVRVSWGALAAEPSSRHSLHYPLVLNLTTTLTQPFLFEVLFCIVISSIHSVSTALYPKADIRPIFSSMRNPENCAFIHIHWPSHELLLIQTLCFAYKPIWNTFKNTYWNPSLHIFLYSFIYISRII
jgi:hypothetical protein